jgi:hypothetical protein
MGGEMHFALSGIEDRNLSALVVSLPEGAEVKQFTRSGFYWGAWGNYNCDREKLINAVKPYCWRFEDRKE